MDLLSDVIVSMRTGRPGAGRVEWHEPWGYDFPTDPCTAGFLIVVRGSGWLRAEGQPPAELAAGDVVFSPRGDAYAISSEPTTPLTTAVPALEPAAMYESVTAGTPGGRTTVTLCGGYRIDPARAHPMLSELPATLHLRPQPGRHPQLQGAVAALAAEIETPTIGTDALVPALLDSLLLYLLRAWFDRVPERQGATDWAAALTDPAIRSALDAMHREPAQHWTVPELASSARLSRAAFSRRFAALTGRPPMAYLTWWRMTLAARLLSDTDAPLREVADQVGYSSEFAFATAFRRAHHLAPGRYRRQRLHNGAADAEARTRLKPSAR